MYALNFVHASIKLFRVLRSELSYQVKSVTTLVQILLSNLDTLERSHLHDVLSRVTVSGPTIISCIGNTSTSRCRGLGDSTLGLPIPNVRFQAMQFNTTYWTMFSIVKESANSFANIT